MDSSSPSNSIFNSLSHLGPISAEAGQAMASCFQYRKLKKKEHWLAPGEICDSIAYISRGCLRIYFPFEDGTERTARFFFEHGWVSDYESVNGNQGSKMGIEALEATEVFSIKMSDLNNLYDRFPELERIGRLVAEANVVDICTRYRSLLHDTPQVRYINLIETQPEVIDRIPQHYIASFLGIEPESLSRIRKKIAADAMAQVPG